MCVTLSLFVSSCACGSHQRKDVDAKRLGMAHGRLGEDWFMRMSSRSKHARSQGGARRSCARGP
jgi:hypothetical protein